MTEPHGFTRRHGVAEAHGADRDSTGVATRRAQPESGRYTSAAQTWTHSCTGPIRLCTPARRAGRPVESLVFVRLRVFVPSCESVTSEIFVPHLAASKCKRL